MSENGPNFKGKVERIKNGRNFLVCVLEENKMMNLVCDLKLCQNKFITQYTIKETTKSVAQYHWAFEELGGNHEQKTVFTNTASVF